MGLFDKYKVFPEVPRNGDYVARITDINESSHSMNVEFTPYEERKGKRIRYAPVYLRITESNREYSGAASFIDIFNNFIDLEDIIDNVVGITIKNNQKDGVTYHNVVDVFVLEDDEENETESTETEDTELVAEEEEETEDYPEAEEDEF